MIQQRQFVVKIHLVGGGEAVLVTMHEMEARRLIGQHKEGKLPDVIGDTGAALPWTVRSFEIRAMQIFPADMLGGGSSPAAGQPYHRGGSGVN